MNNYPDGTTQTDLWAWGIIEDPEVKDIDPNFYDEDYYDCLHE